MCKVEVLEGKVLEIGANVPAGKDESSKPHQDTSSTCCPEEWVGQSHGTGSTGGPRYSHTGQEVTVAGTQLTLQKGDQTTMGHCDYGYTSVVGTDFCEATVESIGCVGGLLKGKGGLTYTPDTVIGPHGGYGTAGVQAVSGIGSVPVNSHCNNGNALHVHTGDGVVNQGQAHESPNTVQSRKSLAAHATENNQHVTGIVAECVVLEIVPYKCGALPCTLGEEADGTDATVACEVGVCVIEYVCSG